MPQEIAQTRSDAASIASAVFRRLSSRIVLALIAAVAVGFLSDNPHSNTLFAICVAGAYAAIGIASRAQWLALSITDGALVLMDAIAISLYVFFTGKYSPVFAVAYAIVAMDHGINRGWPPLVASTVLNALGLISVFHVEKARELLMLLGIVLSPLLFLRVLWNLQRAERKENMRKRPGDGIPTNAWAAISATSRDVLAKFSFLLKSDAVSAGQRPLLEAVRDHLAVGLERDGVATASAHNLSESGVFDFYALIRNVSATARAIGPQPLCLRVAPDIPSRLRGDAGKLQGTLLALAVTEPNEDQAGRRIVQVSGAKDSKGQVLLECECYFHAGTMVPANAVGGFGSHNNRMERGLVRTVGPFDVCEVGSDNIRAVRRSQVIVISNDKSVHAQYAAALQSQQIQILTADSVSAGQKTLEQTVQADGSVRLVIVDYALMPDAKHVVDAACLNDIAMEAGVPTVLHGTQPETFLRGAGFSAQLPDGFPKQHLLNLIRICTDDRAADGAAPKLIASQRGTRGAQSAPHILAVDDNRTVLLIIEKILVSAGFRVTTTMSAAEAHKAFRDVRFDAAIIDLHLPKENDGIALVRRLRNSGAKSDVPIVILTADNKFDAKGAVANAGADAFLLKPVIPDALLTTLDQLVQPKSSVHFLAQKTEPKIVPVIDQGVLVGIAQFGGADKHLKDLVECFDTEVTHLIEQLRAACKDQYGKTFRETVQSIGAAASAIGAAGLAKVCASIIDEPAMLTMRQSATYTEQIAEHYRQASARLREAMTTTPFSK